MSVSLTMVPLAIALVLTLKASSAIMEVIENDQNDKKSLAPMKTIFNDYSLLLQTLKEHGVAVAFVSETKIICNVGEATLEYYKESTDDAFWVKVEGIEDVDDIMFEVECFEKEYQQNVQSYTYNKLIENLDKNSMKISEETILEDNSIMLTIDI